MVEVFGEATCGRCGHRERAHAEDRCLLWVTCAGVMFGCDCPGFEPLGYDGPGSAMVHEAPWAGLFGPWEAA